MPHHLPGIHPAIAIVPLGGQFMGMDAPHRNEPIDSAQGHWVKVPERELAPLIGPRVGHLVQWNGLDRRDGKDALGTPDLVAHIQLSDPLTGHWS